MTGPVEGGRVAWGVALAIACTLVLATHVYPGFVRIRHRVITDPLVAAEPALRVALPDVSDLAGAPVALILRVSGGSEPMQVRVSVASATWLEATVPAGQTRRLDASGPWPSGSPVEVLLDGSRAGWRLDYLEVANVHGHSGRVLDFVLVPRGYPHAGIVPVWLSLLAGGLLIALGRWNVVPAARGWRLTYLAAAALVLSGLLLVLVTDVVTPFLVLLSPSAFALLVAVLFAPALAHGVRAARASARARPLLPVVPHLLSAALVASGLLTFYDPTTGFTSLIMFGEEFADRAVPALNTVPHAVETPSGYDGQFYAQLALDPLLRDPATARALDAPEYRARRILLPAIAHVMGLGQPAWVLQAYALLNPLCWLALGWILLRWLPPQSVATTVAWCACVLSHGLLASMRLSLTDGPSVLAIALGIVALEAGRPWTGAAVLGVSGLARETNLIAGSALPLPDGRRLPEWIGRGLLLVLPLAGWIAMLALRGLAPEGGGPRNFGLPLTAYAGKWMIGLGEMRARTDDPLVWSSVLTLVSLTTQAAALVWWRDWRRAWWRVGVAYAALMLVAGPAVWEGSPGAVTRVLLPMTVAFNVLLPGRPAFWPLWLAGNANLLFGPAELGWRLWP